MTMGRIKPVQLTVVLAVLIGGVVVGIKYSEYNDRNIIARIGSATITQEEFIEEAKYRGAYLAQEFDKQALLDVMIEEKLMLNKALDLGYQDSQDIQKQYQALLIRKARKELLGKPLETLSVTESELTEHYTKYTDDFIISGQDRLAILFLKKNSLNASSGAGELKSIAESFNRGELQEKPLQGFGGLAVKHSAHQVSRYKGGDIGWFKQGRDTYWESAVVSAGFALKSPGDVSDVVETEKGYYLVRLMDRQVSERKPFEAVKESIRNELMQAKRLALESDFYQQAKQGAKISVNKIRLDETIIEKRYAGDIEDRMLPGGS